MTDYTTKPDSEINRLAAEAMGAEEKVFTITYRHYGWQKEEYKVLLAGGYEVFIEFIDASVNTRDAHDMLTTLNCTTDRNHSFMLVQLAISKAGRKEYIKHLVDTFDEDAYRKERDIIGGDNLEVFMAFAICDASPRQQTIAAIAALEELEQKDKR